MDDLRGKLSKKTKMVAFMAVSNMLGTIFPVEEVIALAKSVGAAILIDAAQHVPHEPTDVQQWDADFVVFSGHKVLGPSGIGILWGRKDLLESMPPFLGGGSMIDKVTTEGFTPGELPAKFEAGDCLGTGRRASFGNRQLYHRRNRGTGLGDLVGSEGVCDSCRASLCHAAASAIGYQSQLPSQLLPLQHARRG